MRHRQAAERRFEECILQSDVEVQNRRIGLILFALIVIVSAAAVLGTIVLR